MNKKSVSQISVANLKILSDFIYFYVGSSMRLDTPRSILAVDTHILQCIFPTHYPDNRTEISYKTTHIYMHNYWDFNNLLKLFCVVSKYLLFDCHKI